MNAKRIADLVRDQLKARDNKYLISVDEGAIHQNNEYWYVPVLPRKQPSTTFEYYEILADVEAELSSKEDLRIWLVPSVPKRAKQSLPRENAITPGIPPLGKKRAKTGV